MKRSEMVSKLVGFVHDATDCTVTISEEDASLLLEFIEKAGMLPPEDNFTLQNKWEKENETK